MNIPYILRCIFLYFCCSLTFFVWSIIICIVQCLLYMCLKWCSQDLWRTINYNLVKVTTAQFYFIMHWYSGTDIIVHMNKIDYGKYFGKEHAYIVSNHLYEIDWWLFLTMSQSVDCDMKAISKDTTKYIPGIGMIMYFDDYLFISRSYDKDKTKLNKHMDILSSYNHYIWLLLCPEGTRCTPEKQEKSLKFVTERNLPIYKHHLCPRTKGFVETIPKMKKKMSAVYDVTVSFNPAEKVKPTLLNVLMGKRVEAHMFIKRIPIQDVPADTNGASNFIYEMFSDKDKLQESFLTTGQYFADVPSDIGCYKIKKYKRKFVIAITCMIISVLPVLYYFYNLLCTGNISHNFTGLLIIFIISVVFHQSIGTSQEK